MSITTWKTGMLNSTQYQGGGFKWAYAAKNAVTGWSAYVGSTVEVWEADGEKFVELDASSGNYGIKQPIKDAKAGGYVLAWRESGRNSDKAGSDPYRVRVYCLNDTTEVPIAQSVEFSGLDKKRWADRAFAFQITPEQFAAAKGTPIYVAYIPSGSSINTYGTLIDKVSLVPVEVEQEGYTSVKGIRFCRWLDSFNGNDLKLDCADNDRDRFRIRIPAVLPHLTKIHIKSERLETGVFFGAWDSIDSDGDYDVTLTQENGSLVSIWMLLVGDAEDDSRFNGNGIAIDISNDNLLNDQTLLADFDSPIEVTFPEYQNAKVVFSAQTPLGDIFIQPYFLSPAGDKPDQMVKFIENHLEKMKEIYRQIGIRANYYEIQGKSVPQSWFDAVPASKEAADHLNPSESNAAMNKVRGFAAPEKVIRVGFVNATLMNYGDTIASNPVRALGFSAGIGKDPIIISISPQYDADTILGITSHEAGHALGLEHVDKTKTIVWNRWLMKEGDSDRFPDWSNHPEDFKRFQSGDFDIIEKHKFYFLSPYAPY